MLEIEEVFKMVKDGNMTLDDFEDWVSDVQSDSYQEGIYVGREAG